MFEGKISKDFLIRAAGLPSVLQHLTPDAEFSTHSITKREGEARTFSSGCNDAFTVFAFMAFLLALLDLILELQMERRKRSTNENNFDIIFDEIVLDEQDSFNMVERNATLATHSIFRGFLNTLTGIGNKEESCAQFYFCEAAYHASNFGDIGRKIARISSVKAGEYLQEIDETLFRDIPESGLVGILQRNTDAACQEAFPKCSTNNATVHSYSYRHPAPGTCNRSQQKDRFCGNNFYAEHLQKIVQNL